VRFHEFLTVNCMFESYDYEWPMNNNLIVGHGPQQ